MGAHSQTTTLIGRTVQEAYGRACRDAEYEDGHSPYAGTIATSEGVVEIEVKLGRVKLAKFIDAAFEFPHDEKAARRMVPARLHADLARVARIVDDSKWGTWVAIRLPYAEEKAVKERAGLKGTRQKVWTCFGWAAS